MARSRRDDGLLQRYGPWALVAGGSDGLGAAFAEELGAIGFNLVLVARRRELLMALADRLRASYGVAVRIIVGDLGAADTVDRVDEHTADLDVGLVVYNAAFAPIGLFAETPLDELLDVVDVNVRGPVAVVRRLLPRMSRRASPGGGASQHTATRRAGFILMSSLSGVQGAPLLAAYSASKAFNLILAQGLFAELRQAAVDVTACCAGAIRTPGYTGVSGGGDAPGTLDAARVARSALAGIGRRPTVVPGVLNKVARVLMTRLLPARAAVGIMAASTRALQSQTAALQQHTRMEERP